MKKDTIGPASIQDPKAVRVEFRRAVATITGKWKLEILWLLNQRVHRFGELRRAIPEVTTARVNWRLNGLVSRKVFAEVPPRVEYAITDKARALKPVFEAIFIWSRERHAQKSRR